MIFSLTVQAAFAEGKKFSWDFSDCEIKDILYAVSLDTGISITADDTVKGKGNFKFVGSDFETAFDSFLTASRLFVSKKEGIWTVSRCCVKNVNGSYSLDVCDLSPAQILEKVSVVVNGSITYDSLPANTMVMHFRDLGETELIEKICMCFSGYEVLYTEKGYHFAKKDVSKKAEKSDGGNSLIEIEEKPDGIFVEVKNAKFSDVLEELFNREKLFGEKNFCVLANTEVKIQRSKFCGESFEVILNTLCAQNGFECVPVDNIFYIIAAKNSKEKLVQKEKKWNRIQLKYTKADKFIPYISKKLGSVESIVLPDEFSLLVNTSDDDFSEICELAKIIDVKTQTHLLVLKYITPEEFMKHLPPGVDKNNLFMADDNSCIYFKGTEEAYKNVCSEIELCDRPVQRISYDLLILQYDDSSENNWSSNFGMSRMKAGERNNAAMQLGSVMNFNLNVVTVFGLNFAAQLQTSIEENKTKVFADTTLHGVSGKQINFQNTNTYRYRDNNVDPETGKPVYSGVTREIISGIKLDVLGKISGDGLITSTVKASVSRQGNDTSSSTGNPPPTTEKIVTTEVCCRSGEPVVLTGLIQKSETESEKRTPLISKIPLLGNLFKNKEKLQQDSQMVIYLVPHIESYEKNNFVSFDYKKWAEKRCGGLYEKL